MHRLVLVALLAVGCRSAAKTESAPANAVGATCSAKAAELRTYLTAVFDVAHPTVAVPWPTGDAARDRVIDDRRAEVRASLKPVDPGAKLAPLAPTASRRGLLEKALSPCRPALDHVEMIGDVAPGQQRRTAIEIADAIGACNCNVDLPLVRALLYLSERGPD